MTGSPRVIRDDDDAPRTVALEHQPPPARDVVVDPPPVVLTGGLDGIQDALDVLVLWDRNPLLRVPSPIRSVRLPLLISDVER